MTSGNYDDPSVTKETTNSNRRRLTISTGNLTSSSLHSTPLPILPFELIVEEILCRLPVNLLLQLRCICKSWKNLISDPKFAKKHLHLSTKRHHLIVSSKNNLGESILLDSPISSVFSTSIVKQTQLSYPFTHKVLTKSLSSCDGILCFVISDSTAVLWNPSIRKLKVLPPFENHRKKRPFPCYSFGYDNFIDKYKIIGINKDEVSVLTLGDDYWRRIQDYPYGGRLSVPGIFVSGTVNWLANALGSPCALVSLDLKNESFQKLPQPDRENGFCILGELRDCLSIFAKYIEFMDVWIMKEYGNKDSWTKLYTVPSYLLEGGLHAYAYTKALYVSEDDQMLMDFLEFGSNELKLVVFDSKYDTLNFLEIQNISRWMNPVVYIESLVSPGS